MNLSGDPHFGGKWKSSFFLTQLLCKEKKSCQENLFLSTSRVDHQTKKSHHETSSGGTFAFESISDLRPLRSLCSASDVQFVGVFMGCIYGHTHILTH